MPEIRVNPEKYSKANVGVIVSVILYHIKSLQQVCNLISEIVKLFIEDNSSRHHMYIIIGIPILKSTDMEWNFGPVYGVHVMLLDTTLLLEKP